MAESRAGDPPQASIDPLSERAVFVDADLAIGYGDETSSEPKAPSTPFSCSRLEPSKLAT
jgi:hypothetical protein